ncbi:glycerol-3-phosphate responsive antiterminator [Paenactinomyces guangxiensis]|uniref:Glycerol uptake operon antiterminator regulatory protein n=1 Tax=Paenactinomyces guangxiensis TaxID=1490290 RepID=A0A7W1WUZ0_9BACL|nr:glycerol-3-phosphate responsive antiterminator [Paenactinomyces guangxiensis]MBA4496539.1 glycerol-3-phosphate responsive antiterminator [Paenactinomyces guangxiensis]MBH8593669.1 glycerol-3-phosphate responsive antiterminator [Paenactinomyces guangxiensis]
MHFNGQKVLPAAKSIKDFEKLMKTRFEYIVLLDSHVAQLKSLINLANRHHKKVLLHVDLIQGLRSDEYAAEFLCQSIKPAGLISTRTPVVSIAKKKSLIAIQRIFLLDTHALSTSYRLLKTFKPDYIEVLPGIMPHIIKEVAENTGIPILAGGLIRTIEEVNESIGAGAVAATTSSERIWKTFF